MSGARLSIVMFSALLSHGGGRETWLNNVLPELLKLQKFDCIDVYFVADASTDCYPKIPVISDPRVRFISTRLPVGTNKLKSVARIFLFCINIVRHLRRYSSEGHYVVAIGTFYEGAVLALIRALSFRPPVLVVWIRGVWTKEINHRHGPMVRNLICIFEKLFMHCADRIISNGQDTKIFYEALLARHVEAIPNALDVKKYASVSRKAFSSNQKIVSFIGRLSEEKGLRAYLSAIEMYLAIHACSKLSFDIVGDGPLRNVVEQFVSRFNEAVRYVGPISNEKMLAYLETIDAGVCLTYSKSLGGGGVSNGLLELVGARRLVIAWDSPIYKQVLNGEQAMFVEESEIVQLASCFAALNTDPASMCERISKSVDVLSLYSLEHHVSHFIEYVRR